MGFTDFQWNERAKAKVHRALEALKINVRPIFQSAKQVDGLIASGRFQPGLYIALNPTIQFNQPSSSEEHPVEQYYRMLRDTEKQTGYRIKLHVAWVQNAMWHVFPEFRNSPDPHGDFLRNCSPSQKEALERFWRASPYICGNGARFCTYEISWIEFTRIEEELKEELNQISRNAAIARENGSPCPRCRLGEFALDIVWVMLDSEGQAPPRTSTPLYSRNRDLPSPTPSGKKPIDAITVTTVGSNVRYMNVTNDVSAD